jgi:hypothetical protein
MLKICLFIYIFGGSATLYAQSIGQREPKTTLTSHPELSSRKLSTAQMQAYTKRAQQKLADMAEYAQLCLQTKQGDEQKQALKQLQSLFWEVPAWAKDLPALRTHISTQKSTVLTQSSVAEALAPQDAQTYKGKLAYTWLGRQAQMPFIVRKNKKQIGSKEVEVWEVFLSDF